MKINIINKTGNIIGFCNLHYNDIGDWITLEKKGIKIESNIRKTNKELEEYENELNIILE